MSESKVLPIGGLLTQHRRRLQLWGLLVGISLVFLAARALWPELLPLNGLLGAEPGIVLLGVFISAMLCEYLDSSLGMGYGTTLTPLLLLAGYSPLQIVPAVLFSELLTGMTAGIFHHRDGNIDLLRDRHARRTLMLLTLLSAAGAVAAVTLAIRLSHFWLTLTITLIVLSMGVITLATIRRRLPYRPGNIIALGLVAAFNKSLSGGGYGPLVTAGQLVSGLPARHAVATTSVAEAFTCLVGLVGYLMLTGRPDWSLAAPLAAGALLSTPIATLTVKHLSETILRAAVGSLTLVLGIVSMIKLLC